MSDCEHWMSEVIPCKYCDTTARVMARGRFTKTANGIRPLPDAQQIVEKLQAEHWQVFLHPKFSAVCPECRYKLGPIAVIGVDPTGTQTMGLSAFDWAGKLVASESHRCPKAKTKISLLSWEERKTHYRSCASFQVSRLKTFAWKHGVTDQAFLAIEEMYVKRVETAAMMARVQGYLQAAGDDLGMNVVSLLPSVWKKEAFGNGGMHPREVQVMVREMFKMPKRIQRDEACSVGIGLAGYLIYCDVCPARVEEMSEYEGRDERET